jgi:hypothetical protein
VSSQIRITGLDISPDELVPGQGKVRRIQASVDLAAARGPA